MNNISLVALAIAYAPIVNSIVEDTMDAIDVAQLQAAITEYKDINNSTTDEAQMALARMFDDALDFAKALEDAGVPFDAIGKLIEYYDGKLFYWAIKIAVKSHSRKRQRNMRRFQRRLHKALAENVYESNL